MKSIRISSALMALFLPALVWGNEDCPCPGEQPYAGQDGCGTDVCDPADVGTYPVDCDGDGVGDECEESDCPVVTSITADLSGKEVGDTLILSDFSITTSPENESVTLSGDLTISNGQGTVTAKASDYDDGKSFSYGAVDREINISFNNSTKKIEVEGMSIGMGGTLKVLVDGISFGSLTLTEGVASTYSLDPESLDMPGSVTCVSDEIEGDIEVSSADVVGPLKGIYEMVVSKCPMKVTETPTSNWIYVNTENDDYEPKTLGVRFSAEAGGYAHVSFGTALNYVDDPKVGITAEQLDTCVYSDPDEGTERTVYPANSAEWTYVGKSHRDYKFSGQKASAVKQFSGWFSINAAEANLKGMVLSPESTQRWGEDLENTWIAKISY